MSGCSEATCCLQDHVEAVAPRPPDQRPCRTWGAVCASGRGRMSRGDESTGRPPWSWGYDPACHHLPLRPRLWAGGRPTDGPLLAGQAASGPALASPPLSLDRSYPVLLREAPGLVLGTHAPAGALHCAGGCLLPAAMSQPLLQRLKLPLLCVCVSMVT